MFCQNTQIKKLLTILVLQHIFKPVFYLISIIVLFISLRGIFVSIFIINLLCCADKFGNFSVKDLS